MNSQNHTAKKKTLLLTDEPRTTEAILCRSLFGNFTTHVTNREVKLIDSCQEYDNIILSSDCIDTCTTIYNNYLLGKYRLHFLKCTDIVEEQLDNESIFAFTLFNLELFSKKSLRAKATYIANNSIDDIGKDKYRDIFNSELLDKAPLLYINLYRVIAFDEQTALIKIFELLKDLDDTKIATYLDSFLVLILNSNSTIKFSETLISYYEDVDCIESPHKYLIFQFLNKIYRKINKSEILKINNRLYPIISYCLSEDVEGEYVDLMNSYVNSFPADTMNLITNRIIIYAKVLGNHKYLEAFYSNLAQPKTKLEHSYQNLLLKIENLVDTQKLSDIPELELKRGVDQYIKFLKDNNKPDKCSPMFELLFS